jgi:uncharacterized protein with gpF-like domain
MERDKRAGMRGDTKNTVRAVRPNVGLRLRYRKQMLALIDEMNASILYWLSAQYKDAPPALAMDATPSQKMLAKFRALAKRWERKFDEAAPRIAEAYVKGNFYATSSAMRSALRDAGVSVRFKLTREMKDAMNASVAENVALIRSIPQRYLGQTEGIVTRAYAAGRDLESMVKEIRKLYPKAAGSAELISLDQSNKLNSTVENARRLELGIEQAIWMHSGGGKHPRKNHQKASGTVYNIREGCPIRDERSGQLEYIQPGQKIRCRCVSRSVLPALRGA